MGSVKQSKGGIVVDWCKHMRPFLRRLHWKKVRNKIKQDIKKDMEE